MAAPLSFPDGCRYKCGGQAGGIKKKIPVCERMCVSGRGFFLLADADGYERRTDLS